MKGLVNFCVIIFIMSALALSLQAQEKQAISKEDYSNTKVEMADTMRQEGKIYVVVSVLVLMMLGFFAYLAYTERKLAKMEMALKALHEASKGTKKP